MDSASTFVLPSSFLFLTIRIDHLALRFVSKLSQIPSLLLRFSTRGNLAPREHLANGDVLFAPTGGGT